MYRFGGTVIGSDPFPGEKMRFAQKAVGAVLTPWDAWLLLRGKGKDRRPQTLQVLVTDGRVPATSSSSPGTARRLLRLAGFPVTVYY